MIDPRPLDPPEYYDPVETYRATIHYMNNCERIAFNPFDPDSFFDEIISSIQWAIENNETLTIKIK